jgi:hypothetical protein
MFSFVAFVLVKTYVYTRASLYTPPAKRKMQEGRTEAPQYKGQTFRFGSQGAALDMSPLAASRTTHDSFVLETRGPPPVPFGTFAGMARNPLGVVNFATRMPSQQDSNRTSGFHSGALAMNLESIWSKNIGGSKRKGPKKTASKQPAFLNPLDVAERRQRQRQLRRRSRASYPERNAKQAKFVGTVPLMTGRDIRPSESQPYRGREASQRRRQLQELDHQRSADNTVSSFARRTTETIRDKLDRRSNESKRKSTDNDVVNLCGDSSDDEAISQRGVPSQQSGIQPFYFPSARRLHYDGDVDY